MFVLGCRVVGLVGLGNGLWMPRRDCGRQNFEGERFGKLHSSLRGLFLMFPMFLMFLMFPLFLWCRVQ